MNSTDSRRKEASACLSPLTRKRLVEEAIRRGILAPEMSRMEKERLERLASYQTDPVGYARDILGMTCTPDQERVLLSVRDNRYTAVMAAHAVGKTVGAAIALNWWFDCWPRHIGYMTAPTWDSARDKTFKNVKLQRAAARERVQPCRVLDSGKILDVDEVLKETHLLRAINAQTGEGFQGEHTAPILTVLDEAVGVPGYIWEAITEGLMTEPANRVLAIANPTDKATQFGEVCDCWENVFSLSGLNHPNILAELRGEAQPFPGAISLQWIMERLEGEQAQCERVAVLGPGDFEFPPGSGQFWHPNAIFEGRVLGRFPSQADEQVIPRGWLDNLPLLQPDVSLQIGCDVARHGSDRTGITVRSGACVLEQRVIRQVDLTIVTGALIEVARRWAIEFRVNPKKVPILIDETGGLGAGPVDFLAEQGYAARGINSSGKAISPEDYPNVRSELWFVLRERARSRDLDLSRLPARVRADLEKELTIPKWSNNSRGQRVVEEKAIIKKRLGASPDLADSCALAFYPSYDLSRYLLTEQEMQACRLQTAREFGDLGTRDGWISETMRDTRPW